MAWVPGYLYRKNHTINGAAGAGVNYPHMIKAFYNQKKEQIREDGTWCWFQDPKAVYYNGYTYFAWVNANGDIGVSCLEHATNTIVASFVLWVAFDVDDHACPSLLIRTDGRIIVFYTRHADATMRWRISTNPEDITAFGGESTFVEADQVTYPSPVFLSDENAPTGRIYLFYRQNTGPPNHWCYRTSDDSGATFGARVLMFRGFTRDCPYTKVVGNGVDRIHFGITDADFANNPKEDILHCYYEGGSWYKMDGTFITNVAGLPIINKALLDMVYDSSVAGRWCWIWDIALDDDGYPYLVYAVFVTPTDHRYWYSHWVGAAWSLDQEICSAGSYIDGAAEQYYSAGVCLDHNDPTHVYVAKHVTTPNQSGPCRYEMYEYWTVTHGVLWDYKTITAYSGCNRLPTVEAKNCRPTFVRNSGDDVKILWFQGRYTSYTDYDTNIWAYPSLAEDYMENVCLNGKCRPDFGDVRFADGDDGTTLWDYWMQESIDGDYAIFWVEVRDDLAANQTLYVYYGLPANTTISDGDNTFLFYDHFPGVALDLAKWVVRQGAVTVAGSNLILTGVAAARGLIDGLVAIPSGAAIHAKTQFSATMADACHFCSLRETTSWNNRVDLLGDNVINGFSFETYRAGVQTQTLATMQDPTVYYIYADTWKTDEGTAYQDCDQLAQHVTNVPIVNLVAVCYEGQNVGENVSIDYLFVRKWVDPEPESDGWDPEETNFSGGQNIIQMAKTIIE